MGALSDTRREYLFDTPPEEVAQEPGARPGVDPAMSCPNGGRRLQTAARKTKTRPREEMSGPKTMKRQWKQCQPVPESGPAGARGGSSHVASQEEGEGRAYLDGEAGQRCENYLESRLQGNTSQKPGALPAKLGPAPLGVAHSVSGPKGNTGMFSGRTLEGTFGGSPKSPDAELEGAGLACCLFPPRAQAARPLQPNPGPDTTKATLPFASPLEIGKSLTQGCHLKSALGGGTPRYSLPSLRPLSPILHTH